MGFARILWKASLLSLLSLAVLTHLLTQAAAVEPLYTQQGTDSTFAEILASGRLPQGTSSAQGVTGSTIDVNNRLVEAFSELRWKRGPWQEWSGTYTLIKPHGAAIFQAKNGGAPNWAVQLSMNDEGDVFFCPRRKPQVKIAEKMTGKPFHIRVRDNGHDFEVYRDGKQVGTGSWPRPEGETSSFK